MGTSLQASSRVAHTATLLILSIAALLGTHVAHATGETYSLSATPGRTLEGDLNGILLSLAVTNAAFPQTYSFVWTVTDPAGTAKMATNTTVSTISSWSLSVNYPRDFGASVALDLAGNYSVSVSQTLPTIATNVASGNFQVGLTDNVAYERTYPITIRAAGYLPADIITINIVHGTTISSGFPVRQAVDSMGSLLFAWRTQPDWPSGIYTVTLSGSNSPPKNPIDQQQFVLFPTNITISQSLLSQTSLTRSETIRLDFNANYSSGVPVTVGSATAHFTEPSGLTHSVPAIINSTTHRFQAAYTLPLYSETGNWTASVQPDSISDGFGNGGPAQPYSQSFAVHPSSLLVLLVQNTGLFSPGDTLQVQATVSDNSGASFGTGIVLASLSASNHKIADVYLSYDRTQKSWIGEYKIAANDPSGPWLVFVQAYDSYGNNGSSSLVYTVTGSSTPTTPTIPSWTVLSIILIMGAGFATTLALVSRRKRGETRGVKLDIQTIKHQADQIKSDDFFKSIRGQLERARQRMRDDSLLRED